MDMHEVHALAEQAAYEWYHTMQAWEIDESWCDSPVYTYGRYSMCRDFLAKAFDSASIADDMIWREFMGLHEELDTEPFGILDMELVGDSSYYSDAVGPVWRYRTASGDLEITVGFSSGFQQWICEAGNDTEYSQGFGTTPQRAISRALLDYAGGNYE